MPVPRTPAKITVDFTNVEDRGARSDHIPPGDYLFRVEGCQLRSKKDDESSKYLNWYLGVVSPTAFKNKHLYHITSLKPEALWNLRGFLVDMLGEDKVPKASINIPLEAIVKAKKQIGGTVDDDEYEGKIRSRIVATFSPSEYTETPGGSAEEPEEEEEADVDELDVDDL